MNKRMTECFHLSVRWQGGPGDLTRLFVARAMRRVYLFSTSRARLDITGLVIPLQLFASRTCLTCTFARHWDRPPAASLSSASAGSALWVHPECALRFCACDSSRRSVRRTAVGRHRCTNTNSALKIYTMKLMTGVCVPSREFSERPSETESQGRAENQLKGISVLQRHEQLETTARGYVIKLPLRLSSD
jgi:hypothetical protein